MITHSFPISQAVRKQKQIVVPACSWREPKELNAASQVGPRQKHSGTTVLFNSPSPEEVVSNPIVVASISLLNWNFSLVFRAGCNLPSCFYASLILPVAHTLNILLRLITVLSIDHSCLTFSNPFLWNFLNP